MNKLINNILNKTDDSDIFFQSKHINKRKEDFAKEQIRDKERIEKMKQVLYKLDRGLEIIKIAYYIKEWSSNKEELFLELFSKLHVDDRPYRNNYEYNKAFCGFYLINDHNNETCLCDVNNDCFWMFYYAIWNKFYVRLNMNCDEIQSFMNYMIKKYFNIHDMIATNVDIQLSKALEEHFQVHNMIVNCYNKSFYF